MKRLFAIICATIALLARPGVAAAHDFEPGVLVLKESAPHRFDVAWSPPIDSRGAPAGVALTFPAPCSYAGALLDCGAAPLQGTIGFDGMHGSRMQVIVIIEWAGGDTLERLVTGADPRVVVGGVPGREMFVWLQLGVKHIATGFDHLAFVLGLLLVVGCNRRLVTTITAFTLAHSFTLALAATGNLSLASRPVEATIAASVVLVAREGLHDRATAARRYPWLVAAIFGLVHGLGFAGVLNDLGLPRDSSALALVLFNVGVELGQLAAVLLAFGLARVAGERLQRPALRQLACYGLGSAGAAWCIERTLEIVMARSG